jgi:hypothetical protein
MIVYLVRLVLSWLSCCDWTAGNISSIIQLALKKALETMVIFPKWMRIELNDPPAGHAPAPQDPFMLSQPVRTYIFIMM